MEPDAVLWQHYLDLLTIMDYIFAPGTDGRSLGVRNQTYNPYICMHIEVVIDKCYY